MGELALQIKRSSSKDQLVPLPQPHEQDTSSAQQHEPGQATRAKEDTAGDTTPSSDDPEPPSTSNEESDEQGKDSLAVLDKQRTKIKPSVSRRHVGTLPQIEGEGGRAIQR